MGAIGNDHRPSAGPTERISGARTSPVPWTAASGLKSVMENNGEQRVKPNLFIQPN